MTKKIKTVDFLNFHLKVYNNVKYTIHESCAILHRFHVLYISFDCGSEAHIRGSGSGILQLVSN